MVGGQAGSGRAGLQLAPPALLFAALFAMAPSVQADWPQYGHDAARTATAEFPAPEYPDLAYRFKIDLETDHVPGWPIVLGDTAYFATTYAPKARNVSGSAGLQNSSVIYALHIPTGAVRIVAATGFLVNQLASDGALLFASGQAVVAAWDLDNGDLAWGPVPVEIRTRDEVPEGSIEIPTSGRAPAQCSPPALVDESVIVACSQADAGGGVIVAASLDAATGSEAWSFTTRTGQPRNPCEELPPVPPPPQNCLTQSALRYPPYSYALPEAPKLSVIGNHVIIAQSVTQGLDPIENNTPALWIGGFEIHAVSTDGSDGRVLEQDWTAPSDGTNTERPHMGVAAAVGDSKWVFTKAYTAYRYSIDDLDLERYQAQRDLWEDGPAGHGSGMAFTGSNLFVSSRSTLYRFDLLLRPEAGFSPFVLPDESTWADGPIIYAGELVLARAEQSVAVRPQADYYLVPLPSPSTLYALNSRTGAEAWTYSFDEHVRLAPGNGTLVAIGHNGVVSVLGLVPASIQPRPDVSTLYPAVGEEVHVNLGDSGAGLLGPPTKFTVDWGDGEASDWQDSPRFSHRFTSSFDAPVRVRLRHENQSASMVVTFFVGRHDPAVNIFKSPFSAEYQETSFFMLGIIGTLLIAIFGVARAGRKRRRFHRELRELEADFKRLSGDARACENMLADRKSTARALFLEKKLEEAHASFLERRNDELRRGVRLGAIDETLKFLPHGMVVQLQRLLADARVDEWEREQFSAALDAQNDLSPAQRRKARKVIDDWFARDMGPSV